eukprot:1195396-Prorocentrum_minimum.AAC.7
MDCCPRDQRPDSHSSEMENFNRKKWEIPSSTCARHTEYYIATARELTRLDSVTKSPVLHLFGETIAGQAAINAFGAQARFTSTHVASLDANIGAFFHRQAVGEWLGVRMELTGAAMLATCGAMLAVWRDSIHAGQVTVSHNNKRLIIRADRLN